MITGNSVEQSKVLNPSVTVAWSDKINDKKNGDASAVNLFDLSLWESGSVALRSCQQRLQNVMGGYIQDVKF